VRVACGEQDEYAGEKVKGADAEDGARQQACRGEHAE
jgi:hypothetical protein